MPDLLKGQVSKQSWLKIGEEGAHILEGNPTKKPNVQLLYQKLRQVGDKPYEGVQGWEVVLYVF